ncbi:NepR family anti-sigma factor [Camelimonas fluminis]|uniref:NepR family anti-sigma factor n=1 Tax=Camelimonas fluminis TaxID=1576911 RepID=A0ABV7UM46_9HYPH|nr:NepR family anti-sigma factor [Camelimonas fluminis]
MQQAIGSQLRAVYDEVVRLPVPDRFLSLLSSLDGRQTAPVAGKEQES